MTAGNKRCIKCGVVRSLSEFYVHPRMADGHLNKCKACACSDVRGQRQRESEKVREAERARYRALSKFEKTQRTAKRRAYQTSYRAANTEKVGAQRKLRNALRTKQLLPQRCFVCGEAKAVAHHATYSMPLDVTWLCQHHHKLLHAEHSRY